MTLFFIGKALILGVFELDIFLCVGFAVRAPAAQKIISLANKNVDNRPKKL